MVGDAIAYGDGKFVVLRRLGDGTFLTTNGFEWSKRFLPLSNDLVSITFGAGTFVAVGRSGIYQSDKIIAPNLTIRRDFANGLVDMTSPGEIGRPYRLESSSNLLQWLEVMRTTNTESTTRFTDQIRTNEPRRFYRVLTP